MLGPEDDLLATYEDLWKAIKAGAVPVGVRWLPSGAAGRTWIALVLSAGMSAAIVSWIGDLGRLSLPVPVEPHIRPLYRLPAMQMPVVPPRAITAVEAVRPKPESVAQPRVTRRPTRKVEDDKRVDEVRPADPRAGSPPRVEARTPPARSSLAATAAGGALLDEAQRGEQPRRSVEQTRRRLGAGAGSGAPRVDGPGGATGRDPPSRRAQGEGRRTLEATAARSPGRQPGGLGAAPAGFARVTAGDWPALEVLLSSVRRWAGRASDAQLGRDPEIYIAFVGNEPIIYVSRPLARQGDAAVRRALERLMEER